jgi:hypothetical protein
MSRFVNFGRLKLKLPVWIGMLVMLIAVAAGCSASDRNGNGIVSVRLVCADICQETKDTQPPPFEEKTYEADDETAVFKQAMDKAEKMLGEVDYGVYFTMYVSYQNGDQKEYVLNVGREKGHEGLLVDTGERGGVYSIPKAYHDELSELIYEQ